MIIGFTALLLCQLIGETLARGLGLSVPGPVIGLGLLVLGLHVVHKRPRTPVRHLETMGVAQVADGLLANLSLLFVPAAVGVVDQLGILRAELLPIGAAVVISTMATLLVTVLVFVGVKRLIGPRSDGPVAP